MLHSGTVMLIYGLKEDILRTFPKDNSNVTIEGLVFVKAVCVKAVCNYT